MPLGTDPSDMPNEPVPFDGYFLAALCVRCQPSQ